MIPKKIHYCWLSGEPYPDSVLRCMESWRRVLRGYEFVHWDMSKALGLKSSWIDTSIKARKWAFAADYIRVWALYNEGGIYLDADVEVLKDLEPLLAGPLMLGQESGTGLVEAAVIGAEAGNEAIRRVLESFEPEFTDETLPERMSRTLGNAVSLLPPQVLSPKNWKTGKIDMSGDPYVIHHFEGSWLSAKERWANRIGQWFGRWTVPYTRWIFTRFGG